MSTTSSIHISSLQDKTLQKIALEVLELAKLDYVQGLNSAANPLVYKLKVERSPMAAASGQPKSIAEIAAARYFQMSPDRRLQVRRALGSNRDITAALRARGLDMRAAIPVSRQVNLIKHFDYAGSLFQNTRRLGNLAQAFKGGVSAPRMAMRRIDDTGGAGQDDPREPPSQGGGTAAPPSAPPSAPPLVLKNLDLPRPVYGARFRLHEVRCVDETDPEWAGSDDIHMGAVSIDEAAKGNVVPEFQVNPSFESGTTIIYNPPVTLETFRFQAGEFPASATMAVVLAEKDFGGLSEFLRDLYAAIKVSIATIATAIGAAVGAAIAGALAGTAVGAAAGAGAGVAAGSAAGTLAGPIGTIIGALIGAILGALIGWLIDVFKDDLFEPQIAAMYLTGPRTGFEGSTVSELQSMTFMGYGGLYRVFYDWELLN